MHITIDRTSNTTLTKQVYQGIKANILTGILSPNAKLPSSRQLSEELHLSRNVILEAYEQLLTEGYIEASRGSGTYVANDLLLTNYQHTKPLIKENVIGLRYEPLKGVIDFRTGVPNLSLFPKEKWGLLYKQTCEDLASFHLDYHEPRGCYELRYSLANYLRRVRGTCCAPHQIIITTGAAQAFSLLSKCFSSVNKNVIVEDPLSKGIVDILKQADMCVHPIAVDDLGMNTALLPQALNPSLIFTTPSHQFPTGSLLPIKRRIELIHYARLKSSYIVEDDYDSEFRFEGSPIESMQSLDPERVIYVGTFSKILCPALRLGYIILPPFLVDIVRNLKYTEDIHSPVLEQLTLAKFINIGALDTHIRKSKKFYQQKSQWVIQTLLSKFKENVTVMGHNAGIHLIAEFNEIIFDDVLLTKLESNGLRVTSVEKHALVKGKHTHQIMIGYGNLTDSEITKGIDIIFKTIYS